MPPHACPAPNPWLVVNIIAQLAFGLLVMTLCLPSMQEWGDLFGAEQSSVQLTFSAYIAAYGVLQLVYGPLSDRHGRRRILMFGLALAGIGSVIGFLATDLSTLIFARTLQGAGSAAGMVAGRASVQDLFDGPQRTRVMAYVGMAMGVCPPLGTIVGGQMHVGFGWQSNFVLMVVLSLVLLVAAWRGFPAPPPAPALRAHWLREMADAYATLLRERPFLLNVMILMLSTGTFYTFLSGAPIVLRSYGVGPADVGWYIMVVPLSYIVGNFATTRVAHRIGENSLVSLGQALNVTAIGLMLALGLAGVHTALAFAMPLTLLGLGHGLMMPACLVRTVGLVPALAGASAAVAGLMQQLMGAAGGYAVGWVPHDGAVNLGLMMLTLTLGAVAAQVLLQRR
jgi:MFS transporter, DHA1 family, multidrug resistance protein